MNYIDKIRAKIYKDFTELVFQKDDSETSISPSKQFCLEATTYALKIPNLQISKVEIYDQISSEKFFNFLVNDSQCFHGWVTSNSIDYLICAEDIFGGQTVIDLTNRKMSSYSPDEDGFIWKDFHLSPDGKILATIGCYWGSQYFIKLFDFSDPLSLPLSCIKEITLLDNEIIIGWVDNDTLQLSLSKVETIKEEINDGSHKFKLATIAIGDKREIKIR